MTCFIVIVFFIPVICSFFISVLCQACCNICLDKCYINKLYSFFITAKIKQECPEGNIKTKALTKQQHEICLQIFRSSALRIQCPRRCSLHSSAVKSLGIRCSCALWEIPLWFQSGATHCLDGTIFSPFSLNSGIDFRGFLRFLNAERA